MILIITVMVISVQAKIPEVVSNQKIAVVRVSVYDKDKNPLISGSGFIVGQDGFIATNCRVIATWLEKIENTFEVELEHGINLPMEELISSKCMNNLALIKIAAKDLPSVKIDASYVPKKGETIFISAYSPASGTTTAKEIIKGTVGGDRLVRIPVTVSAEINGSPVFNIKGDVIGAAVFPTKKGKNLYLAPVPRYIVDQPGRYRKLKPADTGHASQSLMKKEENNIPVTVDALFLTGLQYEKSSMYNEAANTYRQILSMKPDYLDACVNLGLAYYELAKYDAAIEAFRQAIKIKPDSLSVYNKLGTTYLLNCAYTKAVETFQKALSIDPSDAGSHFNLGIAYFLSGDNNSAMEEYITLKNIDNERAEILKDLIQ